MTLFSEKPALTVIDRSDLECEATCPRQARLRESLGYGSAGDAAAAGEEVHQAIGYAIGVYLESGGNMTTVEIRDCIVDGLMRSRPDVQPDVISGGIGYAWDAARLISDHSPVSILRHDGGQGNRSGQLAWDWPATGLRLTSELDLLLATESRELLRIHDWKSGRARWHVGSVADSFQFTFQAWLVLMNYPDVAAVEVVIHNTRLRSSTRPVEFTRDRIDRIQARIGTACRNWYENSGLPPEKAPAWPSREKCSLCDCAAFCGAADPDIEAAASDPVTFLQDTIAIEANLAARKKVLAGIVDRTGSDIVTAAGDAFGREKPSSNRKPSATFYSVGTSDSGDD